LCLEIKLTSLAAENAEPHCEGVVESVENRAGHNIAIEVAVLDRAATGSVIGVKAVGTGTL
jgi:hypothetical protein